MADLQVILAPLAAEWQAVKRQGSSMALFDESFLEPTKLMRDWIVAPGMSARNGVLTFAPGREMGWCAGLTRRNDFRDFSLTSDVRVVSRAVGLVLRAAGPDQYYMVQFDLANDPTVVWFHTFTPKSGRGLPPRSCAERAGAAHRRVASNERCCAWPLLRGLSFRGGRPFAALRIMAGSVANLSRRCGWCLGARR